MEHVKDKQLNLVPAQSSNVSHRNMPSLLLVSCVKRVKNYMMRVYKHTTLLAVEEILSTTNSAQQNCINLPPQKQGRKAIKHMIEELGTCRFRNHYSDIALFPPTTTREKHCQPLEFPFTNIDVRKIKLTSSSQNLHTSQ